MIEVRILDESVLSRVAAMTDTKRLIRRNVHRNANSCPLGLFRIGIRLSLFLLGNLNNIALSPFIQLDLIFSMQPSELSYGAYTLN